MTALRMNIVLLGLLASPLASYADGADIAQLGVHVESKDGTPAPEVFRRLDGYEASLRFGAATLSIARMDAMVPPGSDITDAAFRTAQQRDFNDYVGPEAHGRATIVGGLDAWTSYSARRTGDGVDYSCTTYTIFEEHLYRMLAHATGGQTRPAEFESALRAMSEVTFRPVGSSSLPATAAASGLLKMPGLKPLAATRDWYPPAAKGKKEQGIVDLEFSVDRQGHTQDVRETFTSSKDLDEGAAEILKATAFNVSPDWDDAHEHARFAMEVQFSLAGSDGHCAVSPPPRVLGALVLPICASAIPADMPYRR
jgi:TonB family protein